MNLVELKNSIMQEDYGNFYIFTGTEIGIQQIYISKMASQKSLEIVRRETVGEVVSEVQVTGFFANEPRVYVVREDKDFQKEEKVWDNAIASLGDSMLILLYEKIDSRLKFGKHFKDSIVEFEKLDRRVLVKYIQQVCAMGVQSADILARICGDSYDIAMLECEKVNDYAKITNCGLGKAFNQLVQDGTIYQSQETDVFTFVDAVCGYHKREALNLAAILKENGTSSITSLGTLYNSMKAIMLIQCCNRGSDVAQITGLDNGAIYYNKKYVGKYDIYDLVDAVKLISKTVSDIKNGIIDDEYAVDYVLCNIM